MTVDINSIKAYHEDSDRLMSIREQVYHTIQNATHPSSADIVRITGLQRTSVTGRIKELEDDGLIYKASTKIDPFTRKTVHWYAVAKECALPGSESGAGEWCKEYCPTYGTGKCHYDPKTGKMLVTEGC